MRSKEFTSIVAAIIILTAVGGFSFALDSNWAMIPLVLLFSAIIIFLFVFSKKLVAYLLDADVEHEIWSIYRYGFKPGWHFERPIPTGIILPLFFSLFSLGVVKLTSVLTYETRALKSRMAKRFGFYSYSEMTDWHNGLIGASGIISLLILAIVASFIPLNVEYLAKLAIFYAFWNLIPISNLDGSQIFFGSRILYSILAVITLIFTVYAVI